MLHYYTNLEKGKSDIVYLSYLELPIYTGI